MMAKTGNEILTRSSEIGGVVKDVSTQCRRNVAMPTQFQNGREKNTGGASDDSDVIENGDANCDDENANGNDENANGNDENANDVSNEIVFQDFSQFDFSSLSFPRSST